MYAPNARKRIIKWQKINNDQTGEKKYKIKLKGIKAKQYRKKTRTTTRQTKSTHYNVIIVRSVENSTETTEEKKNGWKK